MFRPNFNCQIQKTTGKTDVYGMPVPGRKYNERCSIIDLNVRNEKSAVRADTSASRGNAREFEANAKLLLTKNTAGEIDDMIIVNGAEFRIASKFPRHDLQGNLDHYEITCTYWSAR
jgi:hypothetical protein